MLPAFSKLPGNFTKILQVTCQCYKIFPGMVPEFSMFYKKLAGIFEGACKTSRQLRPG